MVITAKNRYGCSKYRASRACTNSRTIPRLDVEERVFEGLRTGLLNSKYLDAFAEEFQREVERLRNTNSSELANKKQRLIAVNKQIERIVDHVVNGTGNRSITDKLTGLEVEQESLEADIERNEQSIAVIPMHNIGQVYRMKIRQLTDGLSDPAIRLKAIETIQSLIDHIKITPTNTGFDVELHGELGAVMEMVDQNERTPRRVNCGAFVYGGCGSRI